MAAPFSISLPFTKVMFLKFTSLTLSLILNILEYPSASKIVPSVPIIVNGLSIIMFALISLI